MALSRRVAWSVPAATAGIVVVAGVLSQTTALGESRTPLPQRSAAELLAAVQRSPATALSGTFVETSRLGLPDLPGSGGSSAALSLQNLATGSHAARVWVDGPERQRIALLGQLEESNVVHDGRDVWTYSSRTRTATHDILPAEPASAAQEQKAAPLTPEAAASKALAALDPTTVVTVGDTSAVAGRPVYTLRLEPRDTSSTVRAVVIAVDSQTSVPLRVQVFGAGDAPALETGFTDVSFAKPDASVFRFTPPAGVPVTTREHSAQAGPARTHSATPTDAGLQVVGKGWTSVVVAPLPAGAVPSSAAPSAGASGEEGPVSTSKLLDQLSVRQPDGSRLVRTALVNVLLTTDGRIVAGAVTPEVLNSAARR